jgi:hypothetical protein
VSFSSRLALTAATVTAAAATIAAGPPETGFDRPGGVYSNVATKDAAACAIACAQDRICMSWTFRITEYVGCSLKAVVPPAIADRDAVSGVDDRAGDFLSLVSNAPLPAPPSAEPPPSPTAFATSEPPPKPPEAPSEPKAELLGAPAGLSDAIGAIAPATLQPVSLVRGLAPDVRPILEISAPQPMQGVARPAAPVLHETVALRAPALASAALVLPPEPEPLVAPATLTARFTPLTRVAYRAPTIIAQPAPALSPLVIEEPPLEPLGAPTMLTARLTMATRIAYRAPTIIARPAPAFSPLVVEEPTPEPLNPPAALPARFAALARTSFRAPTTLARPAPMLSPIVAPEEPAPPAKAPALNDRVVVALAPDSAEQPSSSVVPVSYVAPGAPVAPAANAAEDELLGAP